MYLLCVRQCHIFLFDYLRASFLVMMIVDGYYHTNCHMGSCTGIEILESLHALSLEALERWEATYPTFQASRGNICEGSDSGSGAIHLQCGSITDLQCVDWTDGDLVFVNSTCFTGSSVALGKLFLSYFLIHIFCII